MNVLKDKIHHSKVPCCIYFSLFALRDNSIDHQTTLKNTFREISNPKPRVIQEMPNKAVGYFTSFPIEP